MDPFQFVERQEGPSFFRIASWEKENSNLLAGFSYRLGGVSEAFGSGLNCALHVNDIDAHVIENRKRLAESAGFDFASWTCAEQVHGCDIEIVTDKHKGKGSYAREDAIQQKDGLLTDVPGVILTSFYADCVPLYFYDRKLEVIGLAHAGWKGTVLEIAAKMVEAMQQHYGSNAAEIYAAIGPSIGGCCYEVDEHVMSQIRKVWNRCIEGESEEQVQQKGKRAFQPVPGRGTTMLNLKEINYQIMKKAGILPAHIEITNLCTSCRNDWFFSHRKEKGNTGRMASWIGLKR